MYGAKPTKNPHKDLLRNAQKKGFDDKYHTLLCGAESKSPIPALHKGGILEVSGRAGLGSDGVFDEVCCVRVLYSVPQPQETISGLYNLLEPGGHMIICEHGVNPWRTKVTFSHDSCNLYTRC
jgi:ribosomal protein RSM22 (predicted rRNA methylase)